MPPYLPGMTTAELKLTLIEQIARTDDRLTLRTLHDVLAPGPYSVPEPGPPSMVREDARPPADEIDWEVDHDELVDDDEVIGVRPDGSRVTAGEAVAGWDADVAEVLAGGGKSAEEVYQKWAQRARQ